MCRRLMPCVFLTLASLLPAHAQALKEAEIRALFTGATVAGIYADGRSFSEYHAEDGRALGDNGYAPNTDACWNTDGDKVCYHYGQRGDRKTFCFVVEKQGGDYNLRVADTGRLNAIATVIPGNPNAHGDGGRRWSCDDLLSRRGGMRMAGRKLVHP